MAITLTSTGNTTRSDESSGYEDNDILLAKLLALYLDANTAIKDQLESISLFNADLDTAPEADYRVALTQYAGGADTGADILSVTGDGTILGLAFTDADGDPLVGYSNPLNEIFVSTGEQIFLYTVAGHDNIVVGRLGALNPDFGDPGEPEYLPDAGGALVFALLLQETLTDGEISGAKIWTIVNSNYTFLHPDTTMVDESIDLANLIYVSGTAQQEFDLSTLASGQNAWNAFGDADDQIIVISDDWLTQTVNTSKGGGNTTIGNSNQLLDGIDPLKDIDGESMVFTFAKNSPDLIDDLRDPASPIDYGNPGTIDYDSLNTTTGVTWSISQTQGGNPFAVVTMTGLITDADEKAGEAESFTDGLLDDTVVAINSVTITDKNGVVLLEAVRAEPPSLPETDFVPRTVGKGGNAETFDLSVTFNADGTATVSGLVAKDSISSTTVDVVNRWMLTNSGEDASTLDWDIGGFSLLDTSVDTLEVGSKVFFDDDGPAFADGEEPPPLVVDDTDLTPTDSDSGSFAGLFAFSPGADGTGTTTTYALSLPTLGMGASSVESGLFDTATGNKIYLFLESGDVVGRVGLDADAGADATGAIAFTIDVNASTALVTLTQNRAILHDNSADPVETGAEAETFGSADRVGLTGTITDLDGDSYSATVNIGFFFQFEDDGPSVSANTTAQLDDDALSGGNSGGTGDDADSANTSGTLGHSFGADGGSIAWLTTGAPSGFTYEASGDDLLVKQGGTTVLTVTLNTATGAYTVTQNNPISHASGSDENNQAFTLNYRVTDGDGDTADGTLGIDVDDDTPTTAANSTVLLDDDAVSGGNGGGTGDDADSANTSGTLGHSFGADGGSIAWLTTGAPSGFTYEASGDDLLVKQGGTTVLTVTLNTATGAYTVTQNNPISHASGSDENNQAFTLNYRVTDGDNDTADGTLDINVDDDTPTTAANSTVLLDDDALSGGNAGGTGDDADAANTSGTLGHSFGADGGSIAWLTTGAPSGFTYEASGDDLLVKQGGTTVLTVTLNTATGAYTVTQNNPISHASGSDENNQAFTLTYRVTDGDGDTADGTLGIDVDDDTPTTAANSTVLLDDDALSGGNSGGTGDDADSANTSGTLGHSFGADGGSIAWLTTGAPSGFTYEASGDDLLVKQGGTTVLTVTLNTATGAYTVTQNNPISHASGSDENNQAFTLTYRVTDGDGDTADGTLGIDVDDDTPTTAANSTVLLDDDALSGGNSGGTGDDADSANTSGTLGHSFGADGGSIAWLTTGAPTGFTYEASGDDLLVKQGGTTVLTVTLNTATGAYTVTQNNPISHASGSDENNQAFTLTYRVTDGDGDTADGTLGIDVDDDTPTTAANSTVLLDDDALSGGNSGGTGDDADSANTSGTLGHSFGADGGSIAWLTTGAPSGFTYEASGDDLLVKQGGTTVLTVTLNTATGAYTVTQNNPISHASGSDENNQAFTLTYRVTDGDNDTADGTLDINVDDDTPTTAANSTVLLDDDALSGGNSGGTGDDADSANTSGTLGHSFGADGGSIAWLTTGAPSGFTYEASGDDLLVKQGGTTVLTVTLNTATGAYTVTQNNPISHASGSDENNQAFTLTYRVTDGDNDTADGTLDINVDDDTPTTAANSTVLLDDDALSGGNSGGTGDDADSANTSGTLGHSFGADGGSIAWLTTGAPSGFTYEASGDDLLVKQGGTTVLTVTLNTATGAYTVTQNNPISHASGSDENNQAFTLNYRVTDGDGDTADGTLGIDVDDDTPTTAANSTVLLDDDALSGGNAGGTGDDADAANTSGTLGHSFGADGGSIAWLTTGAPSGFTYEASGDDLLVKQGGTTVLTVTLNTATGAYTVTQNNPISHASGSDENNQAFTLNYRVTDGDGDTADGTLGIDVDDDTPLLTFGNLVGTGSENPQVGFWSDSVGADQPGTLNITPDGTFDLGNGSTGIVENWSWSGNSGSGTLTADFDSDPGTADTSVDFTLTVNADGTYVFDLAEGFGSSTTFSTDGGQLPAGGPDPVQTLIAVGDIDIVFFALNPTTALQSGAGTDVAPAVLPGAPDLTEAQLQAMSDMADADGLGTPGDGTFSFIADRFQMNVSGTGIGVANNVLQGNASTAIDLDDTGPNEDKDESFIVNPTPLLTEVEVFVSKTAGGFAPPDSGATPAKTDYLYYNVINAAGQNSGPILVEAADVIDNGDLWSFKIEWDGSSLIDAVQLTMAFGDIKIPVIEFTSGSTQLATDIFLDFTATLTDDDGDSVNSDFAIDLWADDADLSGSSYTLVDAGAGPDSFDVDLRDPVTTYTVQGFTQGVDTVVLLNPEVGYGLAGNVITVGGTTITVDGIATLTAADVELVVNDQIIDGNFIVAGAGVGTEDSDAWIATANADMSDTGDAADFLIITDTTDLGTVTGFDTGEDGIVVYATAGVFADAVDDGDLAAGELGAFVDGTGAAGFVYNDVTGELSFWDGDSILSPIADVGTGLLASDIDIIV